ncbi:hypothetical protein EW146_g675 [Bondarzewia mesenterica]|uniref:Uncharacterized protein n=1 Tax=Bondarzewia mesenterica TaxID=1095465 RepID=A0A4S4M6C6_9AGAM|nr:hypothetical protein EW146_g675 [Bondarzewia mesenterica]
MKTVFTSFVAAALVAGVAAQSSLTVNTPPFRSPGAEELLPTSLFVSLDITFLRNFRTEFRAPPNAMILEVCRCAFSLSALYQCLLAFSVLPGGDPTGAAILDFGQQSGTSITWPQVNQTAGTSLGLTLRDSNGLTAQSAPFTVNSGSDTSCLTSSAPSSSSAAASSSSGTGTGSASSAASSTSAVASSASSSASSATSTAPSTSHAASTTVSSSASHSSAASSAASSSRASSSGSYLISLDVASASASSPATSSGAAPVLAVQYGAAGVIGAVIAAVLA